MKRFILGLGLVALTATNSYAFDIGTYQYKHKTITSSGDPLVYIWTYTLKDNGRAKEVISATVSGKTAGKKKTKRGNWRDDGDAAIIIKQDTVIEQQGSKYILDSEIPCEKIK